MKALLEKIISPLPMYQIVGGALSILLICAFLCALFGLVSFQPLALLMSTGIFVTVSVSASYGFGKLYGIYSHLRSALITGLILACLFTPTLELVTLGQYALIAVIAQASKFVIVYKKRHILNPAAFGAFLGGVLQLGFASWWIATPPLFLLILIGGLLVLYKTRQLVLAAIFLLIVIPIGLLKGIDPWVLAASWPLLFMLGFMITEPSTLPPRRWQAFIVVSIIALSVSTPFALSDAIISTPELAIIIGNLVAFGLAFRQRRDLGLRFKARRALTPTVDEIVFTAARPSFEPGQYVELTLPHNRQDIRGTRRFFSITSQLGEDELRLGVKFYEPSSSFKTQLRKLPKGQVVQSTGIAGDFTLPKDTRKKIVMIAGGIGITPFISQLQASRGQLRDIVLLYFAKEPRELAYKELLDTLPISVHYFVANDATKEIKQATALTREILDSELNDLSDRIVYISGPPQVVAHTSSLVRGRAKAIKTDYFSGY